jgi:hypothetical protein
MSEDRESTEEERDAYESPCPRCDQLREVEWRTATTFAKRVHLIAFETCHNPQCPCSPDYVGSPNDE